MNIEEPNQQSFELIDDYLAQLHAGKRPEKDCLLRQYPELEPVIRYLEALENLAPTPVALAEPGTMPTVALDSNVMPQWPITVAMPGKFPRSFGRYDLLSEIGRGGMGVVYKARQKELNRIVALKMILASHLASPGYVRRFHIEALAIAKLKHSNIIQIHEVGQINGQDYFTMEHIEGKNLGEWTTSGAIEQTAAVRIVAVVARAVEYLHRQGIVHRDLKPSNILLDAEGTPYLTDFGLAKVLLGDAERTGTREILGTLNYMPPEQASGHNYKIGPAADIYGLGALFYTLLTGRPPFLEEDPADLLLAVKGSEPELPRQINPKISRALELICLKCLQKSPEERYSSAGALAEDLEHFLQGEPLSVRPPSLTQKYWAWTRRQPALAVRLTGLSIFLIVEWINYGFGLVDWRLHIKFSWLLIFWMLISVGCKTLLERGHWVVPARYLWGASDSALLLGILLIGSGVLSPTLIGYPLLIVGSGLWFRVRFVWFMTGLSLLSYGVLAVFGPAPPPLFSGFDRYVIFAMGLVILGAVVAYLVQRIHTLSNFFGQKPP